MDKGAVEKNQIHTPLKTLLAAELFSQLPKSTQDAIIDLLKSLLSHE